MNKNISLIILIFLAALAIWWGYGKMKPYLNTGGSATETLPAGDPTAGNTVP